MRGALDGLGLLVVQIEAEGRLLVCSRDSNGNDLSLFSLLEEWVHHFQQQCLGAGSGLRYFRVHLHLAVQVDLVIDDVVGTVQAGGCAGDAESEVAEMCSLRFGERTSPVRSVSTVSGSSGIFFSARASAQFVHAFLGVRVGEPSAGDSEFSLEHHFFKERPVAWRNLHLQPRTSRGLTWAREVLRRRVRERLRCGRSRCSGRARRSCSFHLQTSRYCPGL